jgi:hypothetical protein
LNIIIACEPTGNLSEKDIHCMAIACHLKMTNGMNYKHCTLGELAFIP